MWQVVEDNDLNRRVLVKQLQSAKDLSIEVFEAENGLKAVEMASAQVIIIIINCFLFNFGHAQFLLLWLIMFLACNSDSTSFSWTWKCPS